MVTTINPDCCRCRLEGEEGLFAFHLLPPVLDTPARLSTLKVQSISNPKKAARGPGQEAGARPGGMGRGQQGAGGGALLVAAGPSPGTARTRLPAAGPQPPGATGGPQRLSAEPQEMQKHCRHPHSRRRLSLCEAPSTCSRRGRGRSPGAPRSQVQPARGAQLPAV